MTKTIELNEKQKRKARELATEVSNKQVTHPTDFLDEWKPTPTQGLCWGEDIKMVKNHETFIDPSRIKGTEPVNGNRFESDRILRVLAWLIRGEYKMKPDFPPHLNLIDGNYYVSSEGNHRSMSHKYLGIDKMFAEVTEYSLETEKAKKIVQEGKSMEEIIDGRR